MIRIIVALTCLLSSVCLWASDEKRSSYPSYDYDVARQHEIKPHRRTIPVEGVRPGFNQLHITLTVSPTGDVVDADSNGDRETLKFWPQLQGEVLQWKFTPFEESGKAVTVEIEEYIDLVPPERLPKHHVAAPAIRPNSKVTITLERSGCFGSCPSYTVTASTDDGIVFQGGGYVAASGKHMDSVDADEVRKLAKRFVAADFYSMDSSYTASVTDNPSYSLSIAIDGHTKRVEDYVGAWEGMPAVITELEDQVDTVARTERWINGSDGLVQSLQGEKFNVKTFEAQVMLKEAARRGQTATVRELLEAGVPLVPLPAPKVNEQRNYYSFEPTGWLTAASTHSEALQILIDAAASKNDQKDKDLALVGTARSGNVEGARTLIAYGANPNADLSEQIVTEGDGMTMQMNGAGSVLIYAAESGNPEMVREILRYHPNLEKRDHEGKTALFAAGDCRNGDKDGARVECVRLLAQAGANVNARDNEGNTPLHGTFLTDVEEELLKLGADVNARNKDGETPIFTTVDDEAIPLFIKHGADLTIRNNKGETVMEADKRKGPSRQEALRNAIQESNQK